MYKANIMFSGQVTSHIFFGFFCCQTWLFVYQRRVKDRGRESPVLFVGLLPEVCQCFVWLVPVFAKL